MAKRGRKSRKSAFSRFDWSINPIVSREIMAVGLVVVGLILLLALFNAAGSLGVFAAGILDRWFGIVKFIIPILLVVAGTVVWSLNQSSVRFPPILGGVGLVIFLPALVASLGLNGGVFGEGLLNLLVIWMGTVAAILILILLNFVAVVLIANISIRDLVINLHPSNISFKAPRLTLLNNKSDQAGARAPVIKMPGRPKAGSIPVIAMRGDWKFPDLSLLKLSHSKATAGNVIKNAETIKKTLGDFGIEVTMRDVNIGPTVTQYTLKPAEGIKLNRITARANDIALALAAHPIRIEAPIPGKAAVGIEVPNKVPAIVTLREVIETPEFKHIKSDLAIALGRDAAGAPVVVDLRKMPHLLIAGATGSGKSIAINSLIIGLLYQNTPQELRLILVDPKRVEFTAFNDIPHLLTPVIIEPDKTVNTLKWALTEMDRRFKLFQEVGSRDIVSYNSKYKDASLPYIVIVIDELADLMSQSAKEVEGAIVRIAQMARAVGMHLVVATQRPSVDVITGLIKANITSRIAFTVASQVDSRTILDISGAEKLLGKGDMLFLSPEFSGKPKRIQGCLITEEELKNVTNFLKQNAPPQYDEMVMNFTAKSASGRGLDGNIDDDLYDDARETVVQAGKASASLLQRRLRIGYARAARLLDLLEAQGVIGPPDGAKPRDILVGLDDVNPRDFE